MLVLINMFRHRVRRVAQCEIRHWWWRIVEVHVHTSEGVGTGSKGSNYAKGERLLKNAAAISFAGTMVQNVTRVHVLSEGERPSKFDSTCWQVVLLRRRQPWNCPKNCFPILIMGKTANAVGEERPDTNVDTNAHANRSHNARPSRPNPQHLVLRQSLRSRLTQPSGMLPKVAPTTSGIR